MNERSVAVRQLLIAREVGVRSDRKLPTAVAILTANLSGANVPMLGSDLHTAALPVIEANVRPAEKPSRESRACHR